MEEHCSAASWRGNKKQIILDSVFGFLCAGLYAQPPEIRIWSGKPRDLRICHARNRRRAADESFPTSAIPRSLPAWPAPLYHDFIETWYLSEKYGLHCLIISLQFREMMLRRQQLQTSGLCILILGPGTVVKPLFKLNYILQRHALRD